MSNAYRLLFPYVEDCNIDETCIKGVETVYEHLTDEISKTIYQSRIMAALTGNVTYMRDLILSVPENRELHTKLSNQKVYVYGAGIRGQRWGKIFPEIFEGGGGFLDQRALKKIDDMPVLALSQFKFCEEDLILISVLFGYDQIKKILIANGIPENRIICQGEIDAQLYARQYFDLQMFETFDTGSVFVDCGCFDGNDSIKFVRKCKDGIFSNIYAFEPNKKNFEIYRAALSEFPNARLFQMAVGDKKVGELKISDGNSDSRINGECGECVSIVKIDDVIDGERVDFIKMDLEGYEEKALLGAEQTIREQKPILAVSVYHKRWDIFRIPQLILEFNKSYRFCLRHYGSSAAETVLYAI